jgi:hypothetical protein
LRVNHTRGFEKWKLNNELMLLKPNIKYLSHIKIDVSEQHASLAYRNFIMTCRSAATRKAYVRCLDHFMKYLKIDTYDKLLDKDPKIIQMNICDFILFMRKDHSYAMVSLYVGAINKFYAIIIHKDHKR